LHSLPLAEDAKRPARPVSVLRIDADVRAYVRDSANQFGAQRISFRSDSKVI